MTGEATTPDPSTGLERIPFFSDAVVAIAITLVALPLVDAARDLGHETVSDFLYRNTYGLIAASASFFAITVFWMWHHRFYEQVVAYTRSLLWANAIWLACIVFLPVATVINVTTDVADRTGVVLYLGTISAAVAMGRVQELVATRQRLLKSPQPVTARGEIAEWLAVFLLLICVVLSAFDIGTGLWCLLILFILRPVKARIRGHERQGKESTRAAEPT